MSNWWMYIEKICDHCGGAYVSISDDSKYCSHSCALSDRGCSDKTKAKLSRIATEQWQRDRKFLMNALASRNMINVSSHSKKLWQDPVFRQKIQSARKAAGYPDPNRPEQVLKRKLRAAVKNALQRTLRHLHLAKTSHTYTLMGYTGRELREHLEKLFLGGMGWNNYGGMGNRSRPSYRIVSYKCRHWRDKCIIQSTSIVESRKQKEMEICHSPIAIVYRH